MAKKVRGHRANKPNDSFGTIDSDSLYKGAYREEVYQDEDDEEAVEQHAEQSESDEESEPSFAQGAEKAEHDYKKRYDDLKKHYDAKISEFKAKEQEMTATLSEATRQQNIALPKSPEELEAFKEQYPDVYDVVETIATMKAGERAGELEKELETIREKERIHGFKRHTKNLQTIIRTSMNYVRMSVFSSGSKSNPRTSQTAS